jgi:hypothetical protein
MKRHKYEHEDTTKHQRAPKNLLNFIREQCPDDDFMPQLAKHHKNLKDLLGEEVVIQQVINDKFIIELNNFRADLIKIASLCSQIDLVLRDHQKNLEKSRELLKEYNSKDLFDMAGRFYHEARKYDEYFGIRRWLPTVNGRPFILDLFFNPFRHSPDLSNEENICNLFVSFKKHDDFFKNFLNTVYADGDEGAKFMGKDFVDISLEYRKIKKVMTEVSKCIPKSAQDYPVEKIESKYKLLEDILEKYPATLYAATKNILNYLEHSAELS